MDQLSVATHGIAAEIDYTIHTKPILFVYRCTGYITNVHMIAILTTISVSCSAFIHTTKPIIFVYVQRGA